MHASLPWQVRFACLFIFGKVLPRLWLSSGDTIGGMYLSRKGGKLRSKLERWLSRFVSWLFLHRIAINPVGSWYPGRSLFGIYVLLLFKKAIFEKCVMI